MKTWTLIIAMGLGIGLDEFLFRNKMLCSLSGFSGTAIDYGKDNVVCSSNGETWMEGGSYCHYYKSERRAVNK